VAIGILVAVIASNKAVPQVSSEGVRVLAREQSLAKQFLIFLNDFGQKDVGLYTTGIMRYAEAKADFDGLITELEHTLEQAQPPDQSGAFQAALSGAVDKRVAFTTYVTDTVLPRTDGTRKGLTSDFIKGGGELIKALTDAGISIWREFRAATKEKRDEIMETLRWPEFSLKKS
jgi:hypothetical protein